MEKKLYELNIDTELHDLIPPLSDEEYRMLEESIVRDGCDTPLTVWNGTIVDGHNRYEICRKHGIAFGIKEKAFEDKNAVMFWMLEHQLARRNLNSYQRSELALKAKEYLSEIANEHQKAGVDLGLNSAQGGRVSEKLAKIAGVGHDTMKKVQRIDAEADDETKRKLRAGTKSINRAYTELRNKEHEGETRICAHCGQEKPYSDFNIPSNSTAYSTVCKECEAKAAQEGKSRQRAELPGPVDVTGIGIRDGKTAHISTGLPDDPTMFECVIDLLRHAQKAFLAAFASTLNQYHPSMISDEHSNMIRQLIREVAYTTEEMLDKHLNNEEE